MLLNKLSQLLGIFEKLAQTDAQLMSPDVIIEPVQPIINKAVQLLKRFDPNLFIGIRKIVVYPGSSYGFVEAGKEKDPAVVHINLPRLISESGGDQNSAEAIISTASTIAHEIGHVKSYKEESGFVGNEMPAENLEHEFSSWIKNHREQVKNVI
jgi:hypothetical protein